MIRLEIKKLRYDINREAAKISALSSNKIGKYDRALARNEKHPAFSKDLGKSKGQRPLHTP